jgi:hypothetical protein
MRTMEQLMKITNDAELTPEEKLAKYGANPPREIRYALAEVDGRKKIVSRVFLPGEQITKEWRDSPAAFGIETHPGLSSTDPNVLPVVADLGPVEAEKKPAKE